VWRNLLLCAKFHCQWCNVSPVGWETSNWTGRSLSNLNTGVYDVCCVWAFCWWRCWVVIVCSRCGRHCCMEAVVAVVIHQQWTARHQRQHSDQHQLTDTTSSRPGHHWRAVLPTDTPTLSHLQSTCNPFTWDSVLVYQLDSRNTSSRTQSSSVSRAANRHAIPSTNYLFLLPIYSHQLAFCASAARASLAWTLRWCGRCLCTSEMYAAAAANYLTLF